MTHDRISNCGGVFIIKGLQLDAKDQSAATDRVDQVGEFLLQVVHTGDEKLGCGAYLGEGFRGGEAFKDVVSYTGCKRISSECRS